MQELREKWNILACDSNFKNSGIWVIKRLLESGALGLDLLNKEIEKVWLEKQAQVGQVSIEIRDEYEHQVPFLFRIYFELSRSLETILNWITTCKTQKCFPFSKD